MACCPAITSIAVSPADHQLSIGEVSQLYLVDAPVELVIRNSNNPEWPLLGNKGEPDGAASVTEILVRIEGVGERGARSCGGGASAACGKKMPRRVALDTGRRWL